MKRPLERSVIICVNERLNHNSPSCGRHGGVLVAAAIEAAIGERAIPIRIERFACLGRCGEGPNLRLAPGGPFFRGVTTNDLEAVLAAIEAFVAAPGT